MSKQQSIRDYFAAKNPGKENADVSKKRASSMETTPSKKIDQKTVQSVATVATSSPSKPAVESKGAELPFSLLATAFDEIESTKKRLQINEILTSFFVKIIEQSPEDLLPSVYLCLNQVAPSYEGIELGIGENALMKAVSEVTGRSLSVIKADMKEQGDLGAVAQACKAKQKSIFTPKALTIRSVFKNFKEIALISGKDSVKRKVDKIQNLMVSSQGLEIRYVTRMLEGKLRIGLAEQSVLTALAGAVVQTTNKNDKIDTANAVNILKAVFNEIPSYDIIIPILLNHGILELENRCKMTPGVPLKPMLAHPTKSLSEVLNRFEGKPFTCEFKYDGERAQIHRLPDGKIFVFSRNSENMSDKYPDVVTKISKVLKDHVQSFVIDSEVVAWDAKQNSILPFQVLSSRKRKDVKESDISVQICVYAFDILYLNGQSLLKETLQKRREILRDSFNVMEGEFGFARSFDGQSSDDIQQFLEESIKANCEGLMVKTLVEESSYEPSKRSRNWLKVKKDYINGMGDSIDLVVLGAYFGKGKRVGTYGGFLLGCYDEDNEEYQTICKIGTGFSDSQLETFSNYFKEHIIPSPRAYYKCGDAKPDVWFDAVQVWEIKAADLSISPVYSAAAGLGISLRFPRFIRIRDDKKPEQATNSSQIADLYNAQANVQGLDKDVNSE